jgi:hypothetical protein
MLELPPPYSSSRTSCGYSMITLGTTYMKHGKAQHTGSLSSATIGLTQANIEFLHHQKRRRSPEIPTVAMHGQKRCVKK